MQVYDRRAFRERDRELLRRGQVAVLRPAYNRQYGRVLPTRLLFGLLMIGLAIVMIVVEGNSYRPAPAALVHALLPVVTHSQSIDGLVARPIGQLTPKSDELEMAFLVGNNGAVTRAVNSFDLRLLSGIKMYEPLGSTRTVMLRPGAYVNWALRFSAVRSRQIDLRFQPRWAAGASVTWRLYRS